MKQRHGCLTALLIVMIVANAVTALLYLFASDMIGKNLPGAPGWIFPVLAVLCIGNVAFAVALFQWKKWAFYGFVATSIAAFGVNLSLGLGIFQSVLGFVGVAILYWALQIGKEKKGWTQLE
jgi:hypothetical protein